MIINICNDCVNHQLGNAIVFYICTKEEEAVRKMLMGSFNGCTGLTNITIPDSVTEIGNAAFYACSSLKNITLPKGINTDNLELAKGAEIIHK